MALPGHQGQPFEAKDQDKQAVFEAYGKTFKYAKNSLYLFGQDSPLRRKIVGIVAHPWFDRFVLCVILLNSLVLALTDWSNIDEDPDSADVGEPVAEGSWRNTLLYGSEPAFTAFFSLELVLKVIAQGFYVGRGSYLRDPWNILDFVVVVTALMTNIPGMPQMSAIRVFRVLRPLRSVHQLPGLQKLVLGMLRSVPQLVSVVVLLLFIFTVFGIFGIQIFAGKQHSRCRLTPYPVALSFEVGMNYTDHRCLDVSNFDVVGDEPSWTHSSSPWSTQRDCWWPLDSEDERLCSYDSGYGKHKCGHDPQYVNETDFRWCGSNYDALGNARFAGGVIEGEDWGAKELTANATFVGSLNWGYTTFDNMGLAFLTIFQSITLEGWSDILYQVKDSSLPILADLFFIVLILWGAFFTLNLLLAVLEANFSQGKEDEQVERRRQMRGDRANRDNGGAVEDVADEKQETEERPHGTASPEAKGDEDDRVSETDVAVKDPDCRIALRRLVNNVRFQRFVTSMIVLNSVVLAIDHHPMDDEVSNYLDAANFAFTLCFAIEMVLKLAALGPRGYAGDRFNLFDGLIVISSLVELMVYPPSILTGDGADDSLGGLSALRTFRVFRVFKLAREWQSMRELLAKLSKTVVDIGYFGLLLVLFMYIYALIGQQFFANLLHFDDSGEAIGIGEEGYNDADVPRSNFDTLQNSFTTIFEILSGENWNAVMYDARRATSWASVLYFVTLIVMGMMIIMTLFLAILLSNFSEVEEDPDDASKAGDINSERQRSDDEPSAGDNTALCTDSLDDTRAPSPSQSGQPKSERPSNKVVIGKREVAPGIEVSPNASQESDNDNANTAAQPGSGGTLNSPANRAVSAIVNFWSSVMSDLRVPETLDPGRALFMFGPKNSVRKASAALVAHPWFDRLVLALIGLSSLALALDNPLRDPNSAMATFLERVEVVMTALFSAEMVFKVCAQGFVLMPGAYLRSSWNVLDFVVVATSVFQLSSGGSGSLQSLKALRALRALRPLRIIHRAPGLKLVLNALFASVPDVLNVAAVCFMFFLVFAILGVTYFKGILMSCQGKGFDALPEEVVSFIEEPVAWSAMSTEQQAWFGPLSNVSDAFSVDDASGLFTSDSDCAVINGGWPDSAACCPEWPSSSVEAPTSHQICNCLGLRWDKTIPQQFNNVGVSLLTFFEISTTEAWTSVAYATVDATEEDMQPIRDYQVARVWFFILFMIFGAYLVMNLFVGVIIDNFKKMKAKADYDGSLVTEEQESWIKTQLVMQRLRPLKRLAPKEDLLSSWCFRLAQHKWFDLFVMICIGLNTLIMAVQYFGQGDFYTSFLDGTNYVLYAIFTFEAGIKLLAFRREYFADPWNRFDFFIVIGSTLGLIMQWSTGQSYGSIAMIIRIFRVGRVLRLVRGLESMAQLFNTLVLTLPSLGNVGALLFLLFFIYAAMGVQLFAKVSFEGAVSDQANFQHFWGSMVLLLRFSTGENWNGFMHDIATRREGCVSDPEYDPNVCGFTDHINCRPINGCGTWAIFPYMITFTLAITYVFLNLFIGVILDGFDEASNSNDEVITEEDFARFARHWEKFDPHATCMITVKDLREFLRTLEAPWGFGSEYQATNRELLSKIRRLNLAVSASNEVHFKDVLLALSEEVHRSEAAKTGATIDLPESYQMKLSNSWRKGSDRDLAYMVNPVSNENVTFGHLLAAELIQTRARRFLELRRASKRALQAETPHGKVSGGCAGDQNLTRSEEETVKPALYSPQSPSVIDGGDGEDGKVHISGNEDGGTQGTAETPTETGGIETMP